MLSQASSIVLLCTCAAASDANRIPLKNPSFEAIAKLKAPPKGNSIGRWVLKTGLQAPADWGLSGAYPGELEVVEGGAADGERFLRVVAMPTRASHLVQRCPGLRRGMSYETTLRYRGGPVELKVYEYDTKGQLKSDRAFAVGKPTAQRAGPWATLTGIYRMPTAMAKVTLAVAVPDGSEADVDDLRMRRIERGEKWLNVRKFGVSGSEYETTAATTAGSKTVTFDEIGDFQVGQQVAISKCNPHICEGRVWGRARSKRSEVYFKEQVQARGYDGSKGNWTVYVLDFAGTSPPTFRWSDDLGLTWSKKPVPVTGDWQALNGGVEVKFPDLDFWAEPVTVSFSGRDQLVSTIVAIEGNTVTLADPARIDAKGCTVQHTDSGPLQLAFDRAVGEGRNIFIPAGRYRLTNGITLRNADGITVEGENEQTTILDLRNGTGACISVVGGTSITIRKLRFEGFSGLDEIRQMGHMRARGYTHLWGFFVKHCNAVRISSPERVLIDNCHATAMSGECFYSASRGRYGNSDPSRYTKSIIYQYCTVTDCARNAFNNNDHAENTAVLYCRIQDVGGCSWEGASRFVKIVGNYFRNAGTVAIGNTRSRGASLDVLPIGQHIVAHNTFEQQMVYGGCAVRSSAGATPVIVSNNVFVNFNTSAIETSSYGDDRHLPSANTIVTGNAIDLTCVRDQSRSRFGIRMGADHATVSDNQIYVRGEPDPLVTGIVLSEPARDLVVHDNIVRGCGVGLLATRSVAGITEMRDARTFRCGNGIAWPRRRTHCYRGYRIAWISRRNAAPVLGPAIETFDPDEGVFRLAEDAGRSRGARFSLVSAQGFNWSIHHNVINNCQRLVDIDVFGGPTAVFSDNMLARGEVTDVKVAVEIRGLFKVSSNQFVGFDEADSVALKLHPDPLARTARIVCRDNLFDQCTTPIAQSAEGVWETAIKGGNVFGAQAEAATRDAAGISVKTVAAKPKAEAVFKARRASTAPVIDGKLEDWDWGKDAPVATFSRTHADRPSGEFTARSLMAYDAQALYLALDITLPKGEKLNPENGVEWSLASADTKQITPIHILWCKAGGDFDCLTAMGADAEEVTRLRAGTRYAVTPSAEGWAGEWRVPWAALGVSPANPPRTWFMNIGVRSASTGTWLVWVPTGGRICNVEDAGELRLDR